MNKSTLRWRFINQTNPAETVLVHDQGSAQTLAVLIQKMGGEWIMQEERPLGSMPPAQPAAPTPAPAPVQTAAIEEESAEDAQHDEDAQHEDEAQDHNMAREIIEAVVTAAHAQQAVAQDSAASTPTNKIVPPPAPKKPQPPSESANRERRAQQRFMTEFRVILISGSSSFRTMSQDVSLGGMRLKKTIPASFMKEKCIAYVSHKDLRENIEIVCHVIGDPKDPCRIQFIQPNQTQLKRLNDWLLEHNQGSGARSTKAS